MGASSTRGGPVRRRASWRRARLALLLVAAGCLLNTSGAAADTPAVTGSVTMVSEAGDWVGAGQSYLFDSTSGTLTYSSTANAVFIAASGGVPAGSSFRFSFGAPNGRALQPGVYAHASGYPYSSNSVPGIDVSGDGRGCSDNGSFDVRDVHTDASGNIDRLWLLYQLHCQSSGWPASFGEVRLNEPTGDANPSAEPTAVQWPDADVGRPTKVVPITVFAGPTARQVSSVTLAGADAQAYSVRLDECTGQTLAAGGSCQVFVRFNPTAAGRRTADLVVADTDGSAADTSLSGFAYAGTTQVDLLSDPGDPLGGGSSFHYDATNGVISAAGSRESLTFTETGDDGSRLNANFVPGDGDILSAGSTYTDTTRYPFNGPGAGMDVQVNSTGCNTSSGQFTVTDLSVDSAGDLKDAGVSFVIHCDGAVAALRGSFQWRARIAAVPSPAPVILPVVSTPPGGSTPAVATVRPVVATPAPTAVSTSSPSTFASEPAAAAAPLTETVSVARHQSAASVASSGLLVTVGCSRTCTAAVSLVGAGATAAKRSLGHVVAKVAAGGHVKVRVRVRGRPAGRLTLTSTAKLAAAPHSAAVPVARHVVLT